MRPSSWCLLLLATPAHAQIFVDDDATGANDGSSWHDAFVDLQSALVVAGQWEEIWVAQGIYVPSGTLDRTASFSLAQVALYGGFAGTEARLSERAGLFATTVLSGDLAGDDGPGFVGRAENSLHVVSAPDGMLFDGFTIQGGNANLGTQEEQRGGGMRVTIGTVRNCIFRENEAGVGGGAVYSYFSLDEYRDCVFLDNRTDGEGGAIWVAGDFAWARITGCRFHGNIARGDGGGAVALRNGQILNSVFTGNSADGCARGGGAVMTYDEGGQVVNSSIFANRAVGAGEGGGGILCIWGPSLVVSNSILWENQDDAGTGQSSQLHVRMGDSPHAGHACIQGWDGTVGTDWVVSSDPRFLDPDGADEWIGTLDDDLQLRPLSPCIDAADEAVYATYGGPDVDLAGASRLVDSLACDGVNDVLDIGALERQTIDGSTNYCPARASSLGVPAILVAHCAPSLAANDFSITASPVPAGMGILVFGLGFDRALWGNGIRCVGGSLLATRPERVVAGTLSFALDLTQPPGDAITAGSSWGFQVLYRDPGSGGAGFNLSDAVRCTFRP